MRSNPCSKKDMLHEPKNLLLNDKLQLLLLHGMLLLLELILMGM